MAVFEIINPDKPTPNLKLIGGGMGGGRGMGQACRQGCGGGWIFCKSHCTRGRGLAKPKMILKMIPKCTKNYPKLISKCTEIDPKMIPN